LEACTSKTEETEMNPNHSSLQTKEVLLKMLAQSKQSYLQGKHKPAHKALTDVREKLKTMGY
jgi:predicted component of type VI protein secretion system